MSWYHVAQLSAFFLAAGIAWNTPRAPLWVLLLGASYVISVLYVHLSPGGAYWPPSQLVGILLDGAVLIAIREFHKEQWEWYGLGAILGFMVTADVMQLLAVLTGFPPPFSKENFGILLECQNYLALAVIGGVGLMDRMQTDGNSMADHRSHFLHRTSVHAHSGQENPKSLRKW